MLKSPVFKNLAQGQFSAMKRPLSCSPSLFKPTVCFLRLNSTGKFPEEELFEGKSVKALKKFDFDIYKPTHSFLPKSMNNPDEPVIFLHDFLSNKNSYSVEANDIAQTLETNVYAVNLRNHNASPGEIVFQKPFNYEVLVNDLVEFCKQNDFEKVHLVGEGLGGRIGLLASLLKQNEVDISKLVVIDNLPEDLPQAALKEVEKWVNALYYLVNDSGIDKDDKEFLEKSYEIFADKFDITDSLTKKTLLSNVTNKRVNPDKLDSYDYLESKVPISYFKNHFVAEYAKWPAKQLEGLKTESPVLFLLGRHSPFANSGNNDVYKSVASKDKISTHFPNTQVKTFSADHHVTARQSSHVTNAICQFLLREHNPLYDQLRNNS